jgi:hypothetical protein
MAWGSFAKGGYSVPREALRPVSFGSHLRGEHRLVDRCQHRQGVPRDHKRLLVSGHNDAWPVRVAGIAAAPRRTPFSPEVLRVTSGPRTILAGCQGSDRRTGQGWQPHSCRPLARRTAGCCATTSPRRRPPSHTAEELRRVSGEFSGWSAIPLAGRPLRRSSLPSKPRPCGDVRGNAERLWGNPRSPATARGRRQSTRKSFLPLQAEAGGPANFCF